jgi:hypothetical protein
METTLGLSWALPRNLVKGNLKRGRSGSDDRSRRSGAIPEDAYEGSPSREILALSSAWMMAFWTQTLQSLFQVEALLDNLESSKNPFKPGQLTRASFSPSLRLVP